MNRLLREPLLHFMVLGAVLFGGYAFLNRSAGSAPGEILVSAGQVEHFAASFATTWKRSPSAEELKGLIDGFVKEEILNREAIKLGLDQNDAVIRRRLQQKMEFIAEDLAVEAEPSDAELADYLAKHPHKFTRGDRVSFRHVFLNPEKHGDHLAADAQRLLVELKQRGAAAEVSDLGNSILLPREITEETTQSVASQFGQDFAASLEGVKVGEWSGPIRSGFGVHLVWVSHRIPGGLEKLDDVREPVKRELLNERRSAGNQKFLKDLLENYSVKIEWPREVPVQVANSPSDRP